MCAAIAVTMASSCESVTSVVFIVFPFLPLVKGAFRHAYIFFHGQPRPRMTLTMVVKKMTYAIVAPML